MKLMFILATAAVLASCMRAPDRNPDHEAELMQTSREWSQAAQSRNLDAVVDYFADDAVMISAGQPPVRGKQAIRASLEEALKTPGFSISWEPIEAYVSRDMGYLLERTRMTMNGPDGSPSTQTLQVVTIWRRADDGSWKNLVDVTVPAAGDSAG